LAVVVDSVYPFVIGPDILGMRRSTAEKVESASLALFNRLGMASN
jgi:hypothetical protein